MENSFRNCELRISRTESWSWQFPAGKGSLYRQVGVKYGKCLGAGIRTLTQHGHLVSSDLGALVSSIYLMPCSLSQNVCGMRSRLRVGSSWGNREGLRAPGSPWPEPAIRPRDCSSLWRVAVVKLLTQGFSPCSQRGPGCLQQAGGTRGKSSLLAPSYGWRRGHGAFLL